MKSRPFPRSRGRVSGNIRVFEFDPKARTLCRGQVSFPRLAPQEADVLDLLASGSPDAVGLEVIERRLWPSRAPANSRQRIREIVKQLRSILGDSIENPCFIETVPGVGYAFIGIVDRMEPPKAEDFPRSSPVPESLAAKHPVKSAGTMRSDGGLAVETAEDAAHSTAMWLRSQIPVIGVLLTTIGIVAIATSAAAYGLATVFLCAGGIVAALGYTRERETIYSRVALASFLIAAGSYIPSATTLTEVVAGTINADTLKPAAAYPFITGLKFMPLFVLVAGYWVLLFLRNDIGFRKHPGSGKAYLLIGVIFLTVTGISVASGSGDYQIFRARLPGYWLIVAGYSIILSINLVVWLLAFRFFDAEAISSYRRLLLICGISYLPLVVVAVFIDHEYNHLNRYYLDQRRPEAYFAANPNAIDLFPGRFSARTRTIGPDLMSLLRDPAFLEALHTGRFYKQDFDELFQFPQEAVMFGYKPITRMPRDVSVFVIIRFPKELADSLRFQPLGEGH